MTLRTRDNLDTVDAHLAFHLSAGVDTVVATDHRSEDGTRDVLETYERAGSLLLVRKDEERFTPGEWVDEMARLAVTELGADWIIHADADEFWWPRGGDLAQVLSTVPGRFGVVRGIWRHFAARPDDGSHFAERMTVRLAARRSVEWRRTHLSPERQGRAPWRSGRNRAAGEPRREHDRPILGPWLPMEVMHFPLRTREQVGSKVRNVEAGARARDRRRDPRRRRCRGGTVGDVPGVLRSLRRRRRRTRPRSSFRFLEHRHSPARCTAPARWTRRYAIVDVRCPRCLSHPGRTAAHVSGIRCHAGGQPC